MTEIRRFVLMDKKGNKIGVFKGHQPRQAALKAANRSTGTKAKPVEIRLRERGTKKVHIFKGWKEQVDAPKNKPKWMPEKINRPNVKKVGFEGPGPKVDKAEMELLKKYNEQLRARKSPKHKLEGPGPFR